MKQLKDMSGLDVVRAFGPDWWLGVGRAGLG
jgi:hypothetical protein